MPRALFSKTGNAVWISHLDLMRLFQRAFQRAGLPLKHTQGFHPRPIVSLALPLPVGTQSDCELLDFTLDGADIPCEEIKRRLNGVLIAGVEVLSVYPQGRKIADLALLDCTVTLEYDRGIPDQAAIAALFQRDTLTVEKKTKSGWAEQDILPMIREFSVREEDAHTVTLSACICCQNPALNPMQLVRAIEKYLPEYAPDFAYCRRTEVYDREKQIFR